MKTITFLFIFIFIATMMQGLFKEPSDSSLLADTTTINPNGASELSILMRDMQEYTISAKKSLSDKTEPLPFPEPFDKIYSAKITDGMSKSDFYNQFADLYIAAVKNYSKSSTGERVETYNNMVSACLACHSQHCPGPVPVIKKMVWDPK